MWKVLILDCLSGSGSLIVLVLLGGVGALVEERASLTVERGSPLLCSMVDAMLRMNVRGAMGAQFIASRREASRNAIVYEWRALVGCVE